MAAGRRGMNSVCTFELLQNIDKNIVVIQFITKITITYQWRHLCVVFLVDFVPNIGDHT